jgi:hypothetical protein
MQHRISLLVVAVALNVSCSGTDTPDSPTQPTPLTSSSSIVVTTTSPTAVAERVSSPFCPSIAPFKVPMVIVVRPDGAAAVIVTSIRLQFADTSGMSMPQVTLPAPVPMTLFGSALDNARAAQMFEVTIGIGCGTGHVGNVQVVVEARDAQGRTGLGRATVSVR